MTDATITFSSAPSSRKTGIFKRMMRRLIASRIERGTIVALSHLTERQLQDIGLSRGQIRDLARSQAEAYLRETHN
jgi:uncharacterized protein YjiS (DUF1127 family)